MTEHPDPIAELAEAQRREETEALERAQRRAEAHAAESPSTLTQDRVAFLGAGLRRLAIIETVILALCAGFYFGIAGRRSADEFAVVMLVAAAILFAIGPFSLTGSWGTTRSFQYLYGQSMNPDPIHTRLRRDHRELRASAGLLGPSLLLGTLTAALALLIQAVF